MARQLILQNLQTHLILFGNTLISSTVNTVIKETN